MEKRKRKNGMKEYFIYSEFYMTSVGLWPYQSRVSRIICQSLFIFLVSSVLIPSIIKLVLNLNDMDIVIEVVTTILYNVSIAIKFVNAAFKREKIALLLQNIKNNWESLKDENEIKILSYQAGLAKNLNFVYILCIKSTVLIYTSLPVRSVILDFIKPLNETRPKEAPLLLEFFLNVEEQFFIFWGHAVISGLFNIMAVLASDTFISSCVNHACGMMIILGSRIQRTVTNKYELGTDEKENHDIFKRLVKCVVQHQQIIKFCDDINSIYSTSFFFLLGFCTLMMSMTGMEIVIKLDTDSKDCVRYCLFFIGQVFHLFCYNYVGQRLVNYGEQFNDFMYNCKWYATSVKSKAVLKFIMLMSLKPCELHAQIFPLSLQNFTTVMKTAMSYFTVFRSSR